MANRGVLRYIIKIYFFRKGSPPVKKQKKNLLPEKIFLFPAILCFLLLLTGCISTDMGGYQNFPPFFTYLPEEPATGAKNYIQALGPLLEYREKLPAGKEEKKERFFAFRPFSSFTENGEERSLDILFPLSAYRKKNSGSYFSCFPFFHSASGNGSREYLLFPFFYYGRDPREKHSFAIFPFYGNFRNGFNGKDTIFILFPFHLRTRSPSGESWSFLYPFIHREISSQYEKFRVFPFFAFREQYELRKHLSLFWPLFNFAWSLRKDAPGSAFLSLPLGGYESWSDAEKGSFLWPFFSWEKRGKSFQINAPWPFFRFGSTEEGSRQFFLWPLGGKAQTPAATYITFLWPLGHYLHNPLPEKSQSTLFCLFPFYSSFTVSNRNGKPEKSFRNFFPFYSFRQEGGKTWRKVPDPGFLRRWEFLERNYWDLFTLYRNFSSGKRKYHEFFWGMARSSETEKESLLSIGPFYLHKIADSGKELFLDLFFGCIKIRKRGSESCVRLFHILEIGKVSRESGKKEDEK